MDKILTKLIKKYFIFKIQEDWKEELKKIPEEKLKKWMDEVLFVEIAEQTENLVADIIIDIQTKWDNCIYMDIQDFVNEYDEELEKQEELENKSFDNSEEPDGYWDSEEDNFDNIDKSELLMYCPDVDENCVCDHSDIHTWYSGCEMGCAESSHEKCKVYKEEEIQTELNDDIPDDIKETGGV